MSKPLVERTIDFALGQDPLRLAVFLREALSLNPSMVTLLYDTSGSARLNVLDGTTKTLAQVIPMLTSTSKVTMFQFDTLIQHAVTWMTPDEIPDRLTYWGGTGTDMETLGPMMAGRAPLDPKRCRERFYYTPREPGTPVIMLTDGFFFMGGASSRMDVMEKVNELFDDQLHWIIV